MTYASPSFAYGQDEVSAAAGLRILPIFLITVVAVFAISAPNLLDPMIRHDDYPAFFADPTGFWAKTLHEGRWVNYIWHLREVVTPAWLNFAVYQVLWAVFAAAIAVATCRTSKPGFFVIVLALLVLVSPSATLISLWFNTLLPGLGIVALYAVLGCHLTPRTHRALLPFFVVASFMAYTTYPLLLLAVCLARTEKRSISDLFLLMSLFVGSFALAILLTYTLNWQVHGIFGVPLAEWRQANPASGFAGMAENLPLAAQSFTDFLTKSSFGFGPAVVFHIVMLVGATLILLRRAPLEALYLHAGLWAGLSLILLQVIKLGVVVPPRTFIFAWVFYAVIVTRAAQILSQETNLGGRMARNFVLLIVGSYLLQTVQQFSSYRDWQAETREIAVAAAQADGPIYVAGDAMTLLSAKAAFIQNERAFASRIKQVTGREIVSAEGALTAACGAQASVQSRLGTSVELRRLGQESCVVIK